MGLELLEYFIKSGFQNQFGLLLKDRRKKRFAGQDIERLKHNFRICLPEGCQGEGISFACHGEVPLSFKIDGIDESANYKTINYVIVLICSGIGASKLSQSPIFIILIQLKLHFRIF